MYININTSEKLNRSALKNGIAAVRELPVASLAARVIANAAAWRLVAPALIGERQKRLKRSAVFCTQCRYKCQGLVRR